MQEGAAHVDHDGARIGTVDLLGELVLGIVGKLAQLLDERGTDERKRTREAGILTHERAGEVTRNGIVLLGCLIGRDGLRGNAVHAAEHVPDAAD